MAAFFNRYLDTGREVLVSGGVFLHIQLVSVATK